MSGFSSPVLGDKCDMRRLEESEIKASFCARAAPRMKVLLMEMRKISWEGRGFGLEGKLGGWFGGCSR